MHIYPFEDGFHCKVTSALLERALSVVPSLLEGQGWVPSVPFMESWRWLWAHIHKHVLPGFYILAVYRQAGCSLWNVTVAHKVSAVWRGGNRPRKFKRVVQACMVGRAKALPLQALGTKIYRRSWTFFSSWGWLMSTWVCCLFIECSTYVPRGKTVGTWERTCKSLWHGSNAWKVIQELVLGVLFRSSTKSMLVPRELSLSSVFIVHFILLVFHWPSTFLGE